MKRRCVGLGLVVGLCSFLEAPAYAADEPPPDNAPAFTIGSRPAWYLMGGATGGGTIVTHDRGWFLGGELSVVRLKDGHFHGLYGDGYYDFNAKRTYATAGFEVGYQVFGIDAGVATRLGGDCAELGPTGRIFLTFGVLSLYTRYAYFIEALRPGNEHVVQIGASLKLPLAIWGVK